MFRFIMRQLYLKGFKQGVKEGYKRGKILGSKGFVKLNPKVFGATVNKRRYWWCRAVTSGNREMGGTIEWH